MLIAHITDTHIKLPGKLAYRRVDTAAMLAQCVDHITCLDPQPDLIVITGDLVDLGRAEEYASLKLLLAPLQQPIIAIPGNHDEREAMRSAFGEEGYLPPKDFLQFSIDDQYPLRLIGLDTLVPQEGRGELCGERLAWLDTTLSQRPAQPTLLLMHHPPFETGIAHMDAIGLTGSDAFADIVSRHPQIEAILCGHLHRNIQTTVGGRRVLTAPSPAHQVALDLRPGAPSGFRMEPPGYLLHWWNAKQLVTHHVVLGDYDGPFPFFDQNGKLID
jgi:Icc protein